jgi:Uma2 family endonuclease
VYDREERMENQFHGGLTMEAQREPQRMTVEEWREMERTSHGIKHEYRDGHVYAIAGGSLAHGRIGTNTIRALEDALMTVGRACDVYNSNVAARFSSKRYTYLDMSVMWRAVGRPSLHLIYLCPMG